MTRRRAAIAGGALVVVVASAAALFWFGPFRDDGADGTLDEERAAAARAAVEAFATHWQAGSLDEVDYVPGGPEDVQATTDLITGGLGTTDPDPTVEVSRVDVSEGAVDRAVGRATVTWDFGPNREWTYETSIPVAREEERWLVEWSPEVINPALAEGELLTATRTPGQRGRVLATDGTVLVGSPGAVVVGIRPSRATDLAATARTVAELTGVDLTELEAKLAAAGPDDFVEVVTLERSAYDAVRDQLQPLPGTVFRTEEGEVGVPATFARGVLGTVGPATEEIAEASDGAILVGDQTGLSGIVRTQDAVLRGSPALAIVAGPLDGARRTLKAFAGADGSDVTVTLDPTIQTVAEQVVADTTEPSALVVIRASTGDVLAVANGPSGSAAYDRAFIGRYAPGSVFKIASTWALLEQGLTPDTIVDCPATLTAGKTFKNAGDMALGAVPFRTDFARSCNTAFVGLADRITAQQLADAASELGYRPLDLGAPMFAASVPVDGDATEHAAQMIGQGRVEGTVANVATMSASIASGKAVQPRLVLGPDAPDPLAADDLPEDRTAVVQDLMRAVVTEGTGTVLAGVPGDPVHAKTGTAEFGADDPPRTHAWITGYQGDLAFAVVVEGGGGGGSVAGPIAADLLTRLAGG
ncbi:MAG: cell division protein FtsI [Actinobacteria bacterium]|nr:cell division protein FtsI [Actinomycetota bacterium]